MLFYTSCKRFYKNFLCMLYRVVDWAKYISTYLYIGIIVFNNNTIRKKSYSQLGNTKTVSFSQSTNSNNFSCCCLPFLQAGGSPGVGGCFTTSCKVMAVSTGTRCNELCPCSCLIVQGKRMFDSHVQVCEAMHAS